MHTFVARSLLALPLFAATAVACSPPGPPSPPPGFDYTVESVPEDAGTGTAFCAQPSSDATNVPGAQVPQGLCIRRYARVPEARVLQFAPNGDLFVAAPSMNTAGGATGGAGAILVLHDDNQDGVAEIATFADGLADVHGMAFAGGFLYFTTATAVFRTPYTTGQRSETPAARTQVATFATPMNARWTHGMGATPNGTVYATQGVYSASTCPDTPREGSVNQVDPGGAGLTVLASRLRNPMYMRCHFRDEMCLFAELGDDGGSSFGARERMVLLRADTNYGFPCCVTTGQNAPLNHGEMDCARVPQEESSFPLFDTPFGIDWERGRWPAPLRDVVFVALHGSFYTDPQWQGARIVFATTDPTTHVPNGTWRDVVRGFGPGGSVLERPSDLAFAPDGRLFFADDQGGAVYWVAPTNLRAP